jgi:hypothetical protein
MRCGVVCALLLGATSASAQEISGGVGVAGVMAGTSPRGAVSPHVGVLWRTNGGLLFAVHDSCSVLPEVDRFGLGVYNTLSFAIGYASATTQLAAGPALSVYSLPMCGPEWCGPANGIAAGGSARATVYFAGALGVSASAGVEYMNNQLLPGGIATTFIAGLVLRWSAK